MGFWGFHLKGSAKELVLALPTKVVEVLKRFSHHELVSKEVRLRVCVLERRWSWDLRDGLGYFWVSGFDDDGTIMWGDDSGFG